MLSKNCTKKNCPVQKCQSTKIVETSSNELLSAQNFSERFGVVIPVFFFSFISMNGKKNMNPNQV